MPCILDTARVASPPAKGGPITLGALLTNTWIPQKRRHVRATIAYRYAWFVERDINPAVGDIRFVGSTERSVGRPAERWLLEDAGPVLDELNAPVERAAFGHL